MGKVKVKTEEGYWKRFGKYFVKNWQLYIIFLLPALLMTIIFKYLPMLGIIIAFEEYSPIKGYFLMSFSFSGVLHSCSYCRPPASIS